MRATAPMPAKAARRLVLFAGVLLASAAIPSAALATGGNYAIVGGNAFERSQVRQALAASSFNWSVVPGPIAITITRRALPDRRCTRRHRLVLRRRGAPPQRVRLRAVCLDACVGLLAVAGEQHEPRRDRRRVERDGPGRLPRADHLDSRSIVRSGAGGDHRRERKSSLRPGRTARTPSSVILEVLSGSDRSGSDRHAV